MTKTNRSFAHKLLIVVAALAMFATACGGQSAASSAAETAAATNEGQLALTSNIATTQFLDTADGGISELSEIVTGDRPVLLWYWAPH